MTLKSFTVNNFCQCHKTYNGHLVLVAGQQTDKDCKLHIRQDILSVLPIVSHLIPNDNLKALKETMDGECRVLMISHSNKQPREQFGGRVYEKIRIR